jgi:hypothetical protein
MSWPKGVPYPDQLVGIGHADGYNLAVIRDPHIGRPDPKKAIGRNHRLQFPVNRPAVDGSDAGYKDARIVQFHSSPSVQPNGLSIFTRFCKKSEKEIKRSLLNQIWAVILIARSCCK